jgi:peptidoglycan/xylan/chitin deacetylase (PgdA/CDA1 family)
MTAFAFPARRLVTLAYHDVVFAGRTEDSGFRGPAAAPYKVERELFLRHLEAIASRTCRPATTAEVLTAAAGPDRPLLLTFDDGGTSAMMTAELLEQRGWRAHFFVPTDLIGTSGFVTRNDIAALADRGHIIGSHSCSHPPRMWTMSLEALVDEWRRSSDVLGMVVGRPVDVAAVPGGFYSSRVARAASQAGIRVLFTSEPVRRMASIDDCLVLGRFRMLRTTPADEAAALSTGRSGPAVRQWVEWQLKKAAKVVVGRAYERIGAALWARAERAEAARVTGRS